MKKFSVLSMFSLIFLGGCASNYRVDVNGFAKTEKPLSPNASVYLASYQNSDNPIFDEEIKNKIEYLLKQRGFTPVASEDKADYCLIYKLGVNTRTVAGYQDVYLPPSAAYGPYWMDHYYSYFPNIETVYDQWLKIKILDVAAGKPLEQHNVRWVGEAVSSRYSANLREDVNYLLAAVFEYFGQDTGKRITVEFSDKDPRILSLLQPK